MFHSVHTERVLRIHESGRLSECDRVGVRELRAIEISQTSETTRMYPRAETNPNCSLLLHSVHCNTVSL